MEGSGARDREAAKQHRAAIIQMQRRQMAKLIGMGLYRPGGDGIGRLNGDQTCAGLLERANGQVRAGRGASGSGDDQGDDPSA
ncbi:hypothetical protein GCM10011505_17080 [Tistrella bauzanensis]|uniref:Uncharacterized protein n=1 Tax=Tistrella bauzanensis TaxID=657419 RepID=A0ABQ1IET2_9PROT|nr:hypothetical protein GCM10011505_17080 [Tistrella bauzanensis]